MRTNTRLQAEQIEYARALCAGIAPDADYIETRRSVNQFLGSSQAARHLIVLYNSHQQSHRGGALRFDSEHIRIVTSASGSTCSWSSTTAVNPSIPYLEQMGSGSDTRPWTPMPYTKEKMDQVFQGVHDTGWQLPRKWLWQPHADVNMRQEADKLLSHARYQERALLTLIYGEDAASMGPSERYIPKTGGRRTRNNELDQPVLAECLLNYIGWCPPVKAVVWVAKVWHDEKNLTEARVAPLMSTSLTQGWDVAMIYRLGGVSKDWRYATLRGRVNQETLVFQLPWRMDTDPERCTNEHSSTSYHFTRRQGPTGIRLLREVHTMNPDLLSTIELNGCALIREGHIDTLIRTLYECFPRVTRIGLRDMDFAVTSRAAKTTLLCHTNATDSVSLMRLLKLQEKGAHPSLPRALDYCCGTLSKNLLRARDGLWLMQCMIANSPAAAKRPPPSEGYALTDNMISKIISEALDVFESPRFLNLAQGLQTQVTGDDPAMVDTGAHPSLEPLPCSGPRITMDFGTEFTKMAFPEAHPWPKWGHQGETRRGVCKLEITAHMPASVARLMRFERYDGHRDSEETYALGFVAHLTPMDLGLNPTSQNLLNMQELEKMMRDRGPLHPASETPSTPWDMNLNDWPPDSSGQPPSPSGEGGPP